MIHGPHRGGACARADASRAGGTALAVAARVRLLLALLVLTSAGCYRSHGQSGHPPDASSGCAPRPDLACVRAPDACAAPELVEPECDPVSLELRCPRGAREHAAAAPAETCLPLVGLGEIRRISSAPVRLPIDEGCLWVLPEVELESGEVVENAGVVVDTSVPFGACPSAGRPLERASLVEVSSGEAPIVQLTGSHRVGGGELRVVYRHFVLDPGGGFGVRNLGTGVGVWDARRRRVVVPGADALRWPPEVDLGDAVWSDGAYAYLYGCPGPPDFLTEACIVGRVGADGADELWDGDRWSRDVDPREAAVVFDAGPWRSAVVRLRDGRYLHVYTVGFGTRLEAHVARAPEGPWTSLGVLAECELPADPGAYCAGPVVHEELLDPLAPSTLAISYSVGSTTPGWGDRARELPREYWPRLVRVRVP